MQAITLYRSILEAAQAAHETQEDWEKSSDPHVTFRHGRAYLKIKNLRERLLKFAADMLKGASWALWGGGEKPAIEKPARLASAWKPPWSVLHGLNPSALTPAPCFRPV